MAGPYTWTPESKQPLTNAPIDGTKFEGSLMNNLCEYLTGYFNGGTHTIFSNKTLLFPAVSLRFQQGEMPQPLEGCCIRAVLANAGTGIQTQYGGMWRTKQTCGLEFFISAFLKSPRPDGKNADYVCREASDCLYALLLDRGASIPLQANGFRSIRPSNPAMIQDQLYKTRRLRCMMAVWFDTPASGAVDSALGGDV